jgi:hypothetical protein
VALSVPDIASSSEASDIKLDGAVRVTFGGATNDEIDCCFFELRANDPTEPALGSLLEGTKTDDPTEPALGSLLEGTKTAGTCCAVCAARCAIPSRFRASLLHAKACQFAV